MSRPAKLPRWATDGGSTVVEPSEGNKDTGWIANQIPTHGKMNWFQNLVYTWIVWLDGFRRSRFQFWEDFDGFFINKPDVPGFPLIFQTGTQTYLECADDVAVVGVGGSVAAGTCGEIGISKTVGSGTTTGHIGAINGMVNPGTRDCSITCRVRFPDRAKLDTLANGGFELTFASTLMFKADIGGTGNWKCVNNSGTTNSGVAVAADTYQTLLATIEGGTCHFFIDGTEITAASAAAVTIASVSPGIDFKTLSIASGAKAFWIDSLGFSVDR